MASVLMRALAALAAALAAGGAPAQPVASGPYLPLADGATWTVWLNGTPGSPPYTRSVSNGTFIVNGAATKRIAHSEGGAEYLTNDAGGIRLHRNEVPAETDTFIPPLRIANASTSIGETVTGSGTLNASGPGFNVNLSYSASSKIEAEELIRTYAGAFRTLRIVLTITYSGEFSGRIDRTLWVARNVGIVKDMSTEDGGSTISVATLAGTSIANGVPDSLGLTPGAGGFVAPPVTGVSPGQPIRSDAILVSGITASAAISVSGGEYGLDGAGFISNPGTVSNGQHVILRLQSASAPNSTTGMTVTIGGQSASFSVTTAAAAGTFTTQDYYPLSGSWTYVKNGVPGYTQQAIGLTSLQGESATVIQDSEGESLYFTSDERGVRQIGNFEQSIDTSAGVTAATSSMLPGLRYAPPNAAPGATSTTVSDKLLTYASFQSKLGSFSMRSSATSQFAGFETLAVPAGTFDTVKFTVTTSASGRFGPTPGGVTNISSTETIWAARGLGVVRYESSTNTDGTVETISRQLTGSSLLDTLPEGLAFTPVTGAALSLPVISAGATIAGITAVVPISIAGGEYSLNGAAFTSTPGLARAGDTVAVRLTSAAALGVTVTATLAVGGGSAGFSVTTGLPVPTGLTATPAGPTQISLAWSAVAGAAGYRLYRGGVLVATLGAVTARSDTGLDPATPYSYTLAACDAGSNCSAQSAPAAATTLAASYLLSVAVNGPGSVASNPAGIDCGASCSHSFTTLSIVTLTALAGSGKSFTGWSGACVGVGPCLVTISAARSVTANFADGLVVPLPAGFGLTGNALAAPLDVIALFGSQEAATAYTGLVDAVWSWNASTGKWRFHTPQLTLAQSAAYAAANGYEALASVPAGEGYWVNAYAPVNLPAQQGAPFDYDAAAFAARPPQVFNLLSIGVQKPVSQFIAAVGGFNALWAWDAWRARWYFHSPALEQEGAPFSSCEYAANLHYLDFNGCSAANNAAGVPVAPAPPLELTPGMGFWVEKN